MPGVKPRYTGFDQMKIFVPKKYVCVNVVYTAFLGTPKLSLYTHIDNPVYLCYI